MLCHNPSTSTNDFIWRSRQEDSDEEEVPCSSKKKSKTEINMLKKRLKSIMKKVIDYTDEWVTFFYILESIKRSNFRLLVKDLIEVPHVNTLYSPRSKSMSKSMLSRCFYRMLWCFDVYSVEQNETITPWFIKEMGTTHSARSVKP